MEDIFGGPVYSACRKGDIVFVKQWLDNTENDPNEGDDHCFSPLHWASRQGKEDIVDALLPRGAKVNATNMGDDTPLHLATAHGHAKVVSKLLQRRSDVNAANEHGNTPLHYAAFWCYPDIAIELMRAGAMVSICNRYGETPLDLCKPAQRESLTDAAVNLFNWAILPSIPEVAVNLGQTLKPVPYHRDTTNIYKTRSRDSTLNKFSGIDYKQLDRERLINISHSGELWMGHWQGIDVVAKVLKVRNITKRTRVDFGEEHRRLRIFSHPNVHPVLCIVNQPSSPLVVISEFCANGCLFNLLHRENNFMVDQAQAVKFALDVAKGMQFLVSLDSAIHRLYLSSKHILVNADLTAKINMADVKLSFQCSGKVLVPGWLSPEALLKDDKDINVQSSHMWSYAIVLWELLTREIPFASLTPMEIGIKVALEGLRIHVPPGSSPHLTKLIKICMNEDPAKRPRFEQVVPILEKMK